MLEMLKETLGKIILFLFSLIVPIADTYTTIVLIVFVISLLVSFFYKENIKDTFWDKVIFHFNIYVFSAAFISLLFIFLEDYVKKYGFYRLFSISFTAFSLFILIFCVPNDIKKVRQEEAKEEEKRRQRAEAEANAARQRAEAEANAARQKAQKDAEEQAWLEGVQRRAKEIEILGAAQNRVALNHTMQQYQANLDYLLASAKIQQQIQNDAYLAQLELKARRAIASNNEIEAKSALDELRYKIG